MNMVYKKVQFIAYCIYTAPKLLANDKQEYIGFINSQGDIAERIKLVSKAIENSQTNTNTKQNDPTTLKIFMMPEFFFRGKTGAYNMEEVQTVVSLLQKLVKDTKWKDWLFIFGSIIGHSQDTNRSLEKAKKFFGENNIPIPVNIEAYNFILVQKGGFGDSPEAGSKFAKAVLKEFKSGMDFIKKTNADSGITLERVHHLEPENRTASEVQRQSYDGSSVFKIDGITFGLEVCLDHAKQRLKKSLNLPVIDIQLVPSCGMQIDDNAIVARKGGYIFNCDGYANYDTKKLGFNSKVKQIGSGTTSIISPVTTAKLDASGIPIDQIYAMGAGEIRIYPEQSLEDTKPISQPISQAKSIFPHHELGLTLAMGGGVPQVNPDIAKLLATFATAVYVPYEESIPTNTIATWVGKNALETLGAKTGFGPQVKRIGHMFAQDYEIKKILDAKTGWFVDSSSYFGMIFVKRSQFDKAFKAMTGHDIEQTRNFTRQQFDKLWFDSLGKPLPNEFKFNLWENDTRREIIVAFRGTKSWSDWGSNTYISKASLQDNAMFGGGKVHSGFQSVYASCQGIVNDNVFMLLPELDTLRNNTLLYVTGHSLGGALATMCALHLYERHKARMIVPVVYTFASPRPGDSTFANLFNSQIAQKTNSRINSSCAVRFIRTQDPVVSVPPEKLGYVHVDNLLVLDNGNSHAMTGYRTLVETTTDFSKLSQANSAFALSNEPILLNGMKVIFDQSVPVSPVNLERKFEKSSYGR
jgi:Lipase (class 3)